MLKYNYTAYYTHLSSQGIHDCLSLEQATNLHLENRKKKGITPIAVIKRTTNEMAWYNPDLGLEFCQKFLENFNKR